MILFKNTFGILTAAEFVIKSDSEKDRQLLHMHMFSEIRLVFSLFVSLDFDVFICLGILLGFFSLRFYRVPTGASWKQSGSEKKHLQYKNLEK